MTLAQHSLPRRRANEHNNAAVAASNNEITQHNKLQESIALLSALHSSLDITVLLQNFFNHIEANLQCHSLQYENADQKLYCEYGYPGKHVFHFNLKTAEVDLGKLRITHAETFSSGQLEILEDSIALLLIALKNALEHYQALQSAKHDNLTGLGNRSAFKESLHREIELAKRHNNELAILALDLDHFKNINDSYGHDMGDAVLMAVAKSINQTMRETDLAFRISGEEFLLILTNTEIAGSIKLADRLRKNIAELTISHHGNNIKVTTSVGLSSLINGDDEKSIIKRADQALYRAKQQGRDRVAL